MTCFGLARIKREGSPLHPDDVACALTGEEFTAWEKKQYLIWKKYMEDNGYRINDTDRMAQYEREEVPK